MKKLIYTFLIVIAPVVSFAQFSVGFKAGYSMSDYSVKSKYESAPKGGIATGLVLMRTIGKNIGVEANVLYVQKGYNHQICNQCYDRFVSNFIEVPLTLRYSFYLPKISSKLDNFKLIVMGGAYMANWLNAKYETKVFDDKTSQNYEFTSEKRFDFGPNVGAGLEYALFSGSLMLEYRYSIGVVDMSPTGSTNAHKNKSGVLSLGYIKSF